MKLPIKCKYDELVDVSILKTKFHPKNRNKHPQEQIFRLGEILKYQGIRHSVVISNLSGLITKGHGRVMTADLLDLDTFPVEYQDYKDEEQEYADIQADNAIALWAEIDTDGIVEDMKDFPDLQEEMLGLEDELLAKIDAMDDNDADATPEPPKEAVSKLGDLIELGGHRLLCGDSTSKETMAYLMDGQIADMVFTDPPYNVDYEGKTKEALKIQNDKMENDSFYKFLYESFYNLNSNTKEGGSIYICHADSEGLNFRMAMVESGWLIKQCCIWNKNTMVMGRQDYHWKHEPILYGWKPGASHTWNSDRKQTTVWEFDRPTKSIHHPTMKPLNLVEYAVKNSSKKGEIILDGFLGSGSSLIASEVSGRKCYGMELDPIYCDVIIKRWCEAAGIEEYIRNGLTENVSEMYD